MFLTRRAARRARSAVIARAALFALALAVAITGPSASAQTLTWQQTGSGTYSWLTTSNWLGTVSGTYPNSATANTTVGNALTADQTISLGNALVSGGTVTIGTTGRTLTLTSGTLAGLASLAPSGTINYNVPISLVGSPATVYFGAGGGSYVQNFYGDILAGGGNHTLSPNSALSPSGFGTAYFYGAIDPTGDSVNVVSYRQPGQGRDVALLGANKYRGTTSINGGVVIFNSIADTGTVAALVAASSFGAPTLASSTIAFGGSRAQTLTYIGAGHASNRAWATTSSSPTTIEASGEGTLRLSGGFAYNNSVAASSNGLTFGGTGAGIFAGNISGTSAAGVAKSGAGTWTLTGTNGFSGNIAVNGGTLRVSQIALPSSGTLSFGGGSLAATGGTLTVSNPLGVIGSSGASFAGSESISVTGTLQTDSARTITNLVSGAGKKLTLGGLTPSTSGASRSFVLEGTGATDIGPVLNNTATGTMGLTIRNTGATTLTAANAMTGNVSIGFGTLVADFNTSTVATNKLGTQFLFGTSVGSSQQDSGADLVISGTAAAPITVQQLRFQPSTYNPTYTIRRQSSDTVIQVTGSMTKGNAYFSADIEPGAVVLTTGTSNMVANGIIEGVTAGNDWATLSGVTTGTVQALGSYVNFPSPSTALSSTNYLLQGSGTNTQTSSNNATLKILGTGNDQSLSITANPRIQSLLYVGGGNGNYSIVGGGTYATGGQQHYFIVKTGTLTMNTAAFAPTNTLPTIKSGTGTLVWNTPISGTATQVVSQGVLRLTNSLGSGTGGVAYVLYSPAGSALELSGNVAIASGKTYAIGGRGVAESGAIRSVSGSNSLAGAVTVASGSTTGPLMDARINADSGSQLTLTGGIITTTKNSILVGGAGTVIVDTAAISGAGNLTKDGSGRLELKAANTYTGLTTVAAGELKVNGSIAASTAGVANPFYVAAGATVSGTGTIGAQAYFDGTLAPGNSPGTITYTSDVVWSGSSTWNFELSGTGAGQYDQVVINGGGFYRDTGIAGSDAAGYYKFDFLNTGVAGTFRLVDWSGTTNFATANFGYQNLASGLTGTFSVDNTESALFFTTTQSTVSANYTLDVAAASQTIIQGGSTLITGTFRNTGPDGGDGIGYTGFSGTSSAGTFALSPQSGSVASKTTVTGTGSFTTNTPGLYTIQPTVTSATNSSLGTAANLTSTGSVTVNVLGHAAPLLSIASGGGQTIIAGGTFAPITYTLSNSGSNVSPLQVGSLSNVTGVTGVAAVASGSSAIYTVATPSTTTVASGNVVFSLQAGDDQSYSGASALQALGGTTSYTVLDHATPAFTTTVSSTLALDFGTVNIGDSVAALVFSLTNLSGSAGSTLTTSLDYLGTGADGAGFTLTPAAFTGLAAGGTSGQFSLAFNPTASGTYAQTYTLSFQDGGGYSGATARSPLTVTSTVVVVPEPAAIALAAVGTALATWIARRRRG
jgi:autotransporter-associated beta strand protein